MTKANNVIREIVDQIDVRRNTKWEEEMRLTSEGIRKALFEQNSLNRLDGASEKFNDYCNRIKALLAIYNFGRLDSKKSLKEAGVPETDPRYAECEKNLKDDKKLIKDGIKTILAQVKKYGYYIASSQIGFTECKEILGDEDEKGNDNGKVVPITFSVTTVFTTLVYFRRACKRIELFTDDELKDGDYDLYNEVVAAVAEIMMLFADYSKTNMCAGWGFTLDPEVTKGATLNDTYAVVDAISRYEDAFRQDDEIKVDRLFTDAVDEYAKGRYPKSLSQYCADIMYKVAYNVYRRTHDKGVYGEGIFYATTSLKTTRDRQRYIDYNYQLTTYEQIASSNRSSALFNPLYVAMITMYGYNDKEVVIRRFIDHYEDADSWYNRAGGDKDNAIYKYFVENRKQLGYAEDYDFYAEKDLLIKQHDPVEEYGTAEDEALWKRFYDIARIFQKFIEKKHNEELMNIVEYRDYLNATKDAIDQVQVMYRRFDNSQRLGIVDTDYIMFSELDVATGEDNISISKLNKANLAVNNLRPMLLSSKILIVNALTKYPQADMQELYNAIKRARHRKIVSRKRKEDGTHDKDSEWLWNEDKVDMNSTARHCESIMYDFFDYFERYELGFLAIRDFKKNIRKIVTKNVNNDGSFNLSDEGYDDFKLLLLSLTRNNVELVKGIYQQRISDLDAEHERDIQELEKDLDKAYTEKSELEGKHAAELESLRNSLQMGDTLRLWIREEMMRYMTEFLSQIILNKLNGVPVDGTAPDGDPSQIRKLLCKNDGEFIDANILPVRAYGDKLRAITKSDPSAMAGYAQSFNKTIGIQKLFEAAFNGIFDIDDVINVSEFKTNTSLEEKNDKIAERYDEHMSKHRSGD